MAELTREPAAHYSSSDVGRTFASGMPATGRRQLRHIWPLAAASWSSTTVIEREYLGSAGCLLFAYSTEPLDCLVAAPRCLLVMTHGGRLVRATLAARPALATGALIGDGCRWRAAALVPGRGGARAQQRARFLALVRPAERG